MERLARTLEELAALAREINLGGVAVLNQGCGEKPYVARCVNYAGELTDPTTYCTHATPAEAFEQLAGQMRVAKAERELGAGV